MARTSNPFSPRSVYSTSRRADGWFSFRTFSVIVVCALLFIAGVYWRTTLTSIVWSLAAPLERFRSDLSSSEVSRLRATLASTTALVADRDALYRENVELKKRLGRTVERPVILAGVLLRPPATPYDILMTDAGEVEGVHVGDYVSAGGTTRIGMVAEVYTHSSRVVLFSAPGQTYDVLLHLASTTRVVPVHMQGQGAGSFIGQVPAGTPVQVGDSLVFPGIASSFGGTVSYVHIDPKQSFITLYARLPIDLLSLQYVEIEKDSYAR